LVQVPEEQVLNDHGQKEAVAVPEAEIRQDLYQVVNFLL
jgi:hypothetical protein